MYIFQMIASELDDDILAQTTTLVKSLPFPRGKCRHTNVVRVSRSHKRSEGEAPQIVSSTCQQQANSLSRKTEIRYLKMMYTIEDHFHFHIEAPLQQGEREEKEEKRQGRSFISSSNESGNSQQSAQNNSSQQHLTRIRRFRNKKICLFQKTSINGKSFAKRNTKNIPKNFCKAFGNHMEGLPQTQEWEVAMKDLRKMEKKSKNKYNNILIHRLLSNPRVGLYFKEFLLNHAADWINSSKISDKDIHLQAIHIYCKLLEDLSYAQGDPSPSDE